MIDKGPWREEEAGDAQNYWKIVRVKSKKRGREKLLDVRLTAIAPDNTKPDKTVEVLEQTHRWARDTYDRGKVFSEGESDLRRVDLRRKGDAWITVIEPH